MKKLSIFEIKPGKQEQLIKWGKEIMTKRYNEAIASLKEENVHREFGYVWEIKGTYYVLGYMEGSKYKPPSNSPINIKHKEILRECIERRVPAKEIYDIMAV